MKRKIIIPALLCIAVSGGILAKADDRSDLLRLRKEFPLPELQASGAEIARLRESFHEFGLVRLDETTVRGTDKYDRETISWQDAKQLSNNVRVLAVLAKNGGKAQLDSLNLYVDWIVSQELVHVPSPWSFYTAWREVPPGYFSVLSVCDDARAERMLQAVGKDMKADIMLRGDWKEIAPILSSDYVFLITPYLFLGALHTPSEELAVRRMHGVSDFMSVVTTYSDGGDDILKPDGCGFHHWTNYWGYMYSFKTYVEYARRLCGTEFRISADAYGRMRKAIMSEYLMSTAGKKNYYANSLAGRHPFALEISFSQSLFSDFIEVGKDVRSGKDDEQLQAFYNYIFKTDKYADAPKLDFDGYYQFNYSPAGVYRKDGWVAVMRSPTSTFWGSEIYNKTNRLGRYQAHGSLEVMYDGNKLSASGYPDSGKGAGWDWNVMPGTTTVHYTDWRQLMPNGNDKDRFDQLAEGTNFSGALSCGSYGLWAADFVQGDKWGSRRFEPTNLKYRKSVFSIDGMMYALGSGISTSGEYPSEWITATNLFQQIVKGEVNFTMNGRTVAAESAAVVAPNEDVYFITPCTTGYYIPAGHDEIVVKYGKQESPDESGSLKLKKAVAVKAYINHGVKTADKSYEFVVVPAAGEAGMKSLAVSQKKGKLFVREHFGEDVHIVRYMPKNILAYALFSAVQDLKAGRVMAVSEPLLLMESGDKKSLSLSVCCPDLKPEGDSRNWVQNPTDARIDLKGLWKLKEACEGCRTEIAADRKSTVLYVHLENGFAVHPVFVPAK